MDKSHRIAQNNTGRTKTLRKFVMDFVGNQTLEQRLRLDI